VTGEHKADKTKTAVTWTGNDASMLGKVEPYYVVIEAPPAGNGIFATILTDQWDAKN
jgi:hypothetical protein